MNRAQRERDTTNTGKRARRINRRAISEGEAAMDKVIQIAVVGSEYNHELYVLTASGQIYRLKDGDDAYKWQSIKQPPGGSGERHDKGDVFAISGRT
jgi:hypothetical protein